MRLEQTQPTDYSKDPSVIEGLRLAEQKRISYLAPVSIGDMLGAITINQDLIIDLEGKVKIWASMGLSAIASKGQPHNLERAFIVWSLAKGWDLEHTQGSGKIYKKDLREYLSLLGVKTRTQQRMIKDALTVGVFESASKRDQVYYRLLSQGKAGVIFRCKRIDARPVWVNASDLAGAVETRRATIWAAFLSLYSGKLISQETFRDKTGIPERTQRNYQKTAKVKTKRNITIHKRPPGVIAGDRLYLQGLIEETGLKFYEDSQGQLTQRLPDQRIVKDRVAKPHSCAGRRKKIDNAIKKDLSIKGQVEYYEPKIFFSDKRRANGDKITADKQMSKAERSLSSYRPDQRPSEVFLRAHTGAGFNRWDAVRRAN